MSLPKGEFCRCNLSSNIDDFSFVSWCQEFDRLFVGETMVASKLHNFNSIENHVETHGLGKIIPEFPLWIHVFHEGQAPIFFRTDINTCVSSLYVWNCKIHDWNLCHATLRRWVVRSEAGFEFCEFQVNRLVCFSGGYVCFAI